MSRYGMLACPDCKATTPKTSPNMKRCKPCALKAHGQTGTGFAERLCTNCSALYKPTGSHQKVCATCIPEYRAEQNKTALAAMRRKRGQLLVGTILMCSTCGDDFEYKSGPQKRCPTCQQAHKAERIYNWLACDKERLKQYTKKAKDNYNFGGNRDAALSRDKYTCQHCGSKEDLHVHHVDGNGTTSPKEQRNHVLENLLTLCRGCHTKEHHRIRHSS